jgi:hypothetical protein
MDILLIRLVSIRDAAVTALPPEGSYKKKITFAQYKELIGFDPIPSYLPANLTVSYGANVSDTSEITFLKDGSLAKKDLGRWSVTYDDPSSFATLTVEISCGGIVKDYVSSGKMNSSKVSGK